MAMPQTKPKQPDLAPTRKSMLAAVTRGRVESPDRILLYGTEGCGKTTWAASAPDAVFLPAEDGTDRVDVARLPTPKTWQEVLDAVDDLRTGKHDFKTFVIDTLDAIEPLLWRHICDRDGQANIEAYGYGKGYTAALDEWRSFLSALERLRREKGMRIVLIAHSQIRPFKNPDADDYDRHELKLNAKAGGLFKEWCDSVLFATYEQFTSKDQKTKRVRGMSTGARIVHTQRHAAYDAKSRYALPETLPLDYGEYATAVAAGKPASASSLRESIAAKLEQLADEDKKAAVKKHVASIGDDAVRLAAADNRLAALLAEQAPTETETTTTNEESANV